MQMWLAEGPSLPWGFRLQDPLCGCVCPLVFIFLQFLHNMSPLVSYLQLDLPSSFWVFASNFVTFVGFTFWYPGPQGSVGSRAMSLATTKSGSESWHCGGWAWPDQFCRCYNSSMREHTDTIWPSWWWWAYASWISWGVVGIEGI